jgi:hypothetical protein
VRSKSELDAFLREQQPRFNEDFGLLLSRAEADSDMKGALESLWARYHALLALCERFAGRADAAAEEMCRFVKKEAGGET